MNRRSFFAVFFLNVALSGIALAAGTSIYLCMREFSNIVAASWLPSDMATELTAICSTLPPVNNLIVIYSLPDLLWVFSFTMLLNGIWGRQMNARCFWLTLPLITAFAFELGQLVEAIDGTFDIYDLGAYLGGTLMALAIVKLIDFHSNTQGNQQAAWRR